MSQRLNPTPIEPKSSLSFLWDFFYSSEPEDLTPSFEVDQFQILAADATHATAENYLQEAFASRFDFAEKEIEKLAYFNSLKEPLHMLHVLSLMEEGIDKWKKSHPLISLSTARSTSHLYSKLFDKILAPERPLFNFLPKWNFVLLANPSKTNCFLNVALQTLFSDTELGKEIAFSPGQLPHIKGAFLQYQQARIFEEDPLDLATALRTFYPNFQEEGDHDAAEALVKILEPVEKDRSPFASIERKTYYKRPEAHFYDFRTEKEREAVVTLPILETSFVTLEDLLFYAFNETVEDLTPIALTSEEGPDPLFLPRSHIETRYTSAPKFLIFNLSLGDINLQSQTPEKKITLVGLQRTFYLLKGLTVDQRGAQYRLVSFNVHQGKGASRGHYVHYKETPEGFFAISDDAATKISEIEYLLAAQTAYTIVLEKEGSPISEEALYQGSLANKKKFSALILTFQALQALSGGFAPPSQDQQDTLTNLTPLIESILQKDIKFYLFDSLPRPLQSLLFDLYLPLSFLEEPLSIPKTYPEEFFSKHFFLLPHMVDLLVKRLHTKPEEVDTLKDEYTLIILSIGALAKQGIEASQKKVCRMNALVNEICHLALTSSIIAIKLHRQKKWTFENLKQDSSLVMQGVSSVTRLFFTAIDPLNENKRLQTLQQFILPITTIAKGRYTQDKWDPSPLISPILNWGIPYISSSKSLKTITTNFSPLIFNEVLTPSYQNSITKREFASNALYYLSHPNQEGISSGLSTLHSMTTHLVQCSFNF